MSHLDWVSPGLLTILGVLVPPLIADDSIWVAEGLTIQQVADDDLVPDCTSVCTDPADRIVASGPGYIRVLIDVNNDGAFEDYRTLVDNLDHGAQGLCFRDGNLYYTANNGIWKVVDTDGDGFVDSEPTQVLQIKTGGEHDAHALRVGPDGFWYLIAGNGSSDMFKLQNVDSPIVPKPRAGAIWRISPDWSRREVWAHGFRNAYDFDFAPGGRIDVFDSDGERDVSLPWYRPTRVFRTAQGDDAGWLSRSWKRPNYDPQMPTELADLGRGSPTGVMRYRGSRLPSRLQDGVWVLDWTFGRIVFVGDDSTTAMIARPRDTAGFAVTDITATADGRIVVSVGGRRSRGGLYLIDAADPNKHQPQDWPSLWPDIPLQKPESLFAERIRELRNRATIAYDADGANVAIEYLVAENDGSQRLAAIGLLVESVGGLGPVSPQDPRGQEQAAAVFDGYRSVIPLELESHLIVQATEKLCAMLQETDARDDLRSEIVRALAVLAPESETAWNAIVCDAMRASSPTEQLHRLIALARLPLARSDGITDEVAQLMIEIPLHVAELEMKIDLNWSLRLGELLIALRARDDSLETRLVTHPEFGHTSHLVWTEQMSPTGQTSARRKFLADANEDIAPSVARFIALGAEVVPREIILQWLRRNETRDSGWLCLAKRPTQADVDELARASLSFDKSVREAVGKALTQLGHELPERTNDSVTVQAWLAKSTAIIALAGNAARGKELFQVRQCANCHNGAKALGPSLAGIIQRFGSADLLRATVDPNHTISDRYQAKQVLTTDGRVLVGMDIYTSVDGLTLLTAEAQTVRINSDMIELISPATYSLMPEGLLEGLSDQSVADLIAYLQSL